MEKNDLKKEAPLATTLLKDVQALKEAAGVNSLKIQVIAAILQVQDKKEMEQVAKAVRKVLSPGRPGNSEGGTAVQGDG